MLYIIVSSDSRIFKSPTGIVHLSKDHLVHPGQKDLRDLQAIKEKLVIQETQVHKVKMEYLVNVEDQENVVKEEKREIILPRSVQAMVQEVTKVTKEERVNQENLETKDQLVLKESLVRIVKEDLVDQEILAIQEEMEKMVILVNQDTRDKKEIKEREIFQGKILRDTKRSCLE